jgi:hypothetical protein
MFDIDRIPELPPNGLLPTNGMFAWYDPITDTTYRINASQFLSGLYSPDDVWNEAFNYQTLGTLVTHDAQVWINTALDGFGNNLGNPPGPVSPYWTLEPDPAPAGGLSIVEFDAAAAGIILNVNSLKEVCFEGSADITAPKPWSFTNFANVILIPFVRFTISGGLHIQTLPVGSRVANSNNAFWNLGTREWTPLEEGEYEGRVTYNGTQFNWIIQGPY